MSFTKLFLCACIAVVCLSSCNYVEENFMSDEMVSVSFVLSDASKFVRSSVINEDNSVKSVVLMAYSGGTLITDDVVSYTDPVVLRLEKGRKYDFYALANLDAFVPPASESDLIQFSFPVEPTCCNDDVFPMSWSMTGCEVDENDSVEISLERLAAKVILTIESQVEGMEVVSASLKQVPHSVTPFCPGGNRAEVDIVADGDYATDADIDCLNNGGNICLYLPENMQGTLLPENDDPMMKVLDESSPYSKVCSYLEVKCRFTDGAEKTGEVIYRVYLGEDNVSNFDIKRNRALCVSLTLTESGISVKDSWKIDAGAVQDIIRPFAPIDICFNATDLVLNIGETFVLKYKVKYNDGTSTEFISYGFASLKGCNTEGWFVSDNRVADISTYGVITPKSPGKTTISMSISWWVDDVLYSSTATADVVVPGEAAAELLYVYADGPAMFYNGSGGPVLNAVYDDGTECPVPADWWETSCDCVFYDEVDGLIVTDAYEMIDGETVCTFTGSYQGFTSSIDMLYGVWVKEIGCERVMLSGPGLSRVRTYLVLDDFTRIYVPFAYRLSYDGIRWDEFRAVNAEGADLNVSGYYVEIKTLYEYHDFTGLPRVWSAVKRW